jgi:hypothetical protein
VFAFNCLPVKSLLCIILYFEGKVLSGEGKENSVKEVLLALTLSFVLCFYRSG